MATETVGMRGSVRRMRIRAGYLSLRHAYIAWRLSRAPEARGEVVHMKGKPTVILKPAPQLRGTESFHQKPSSD